MIDGLEQAFTTTRGILANVRPDELDAPTPCQSWDVRRLINHIVGGSYWFAESAETGRSPEVDTTEDTDYTAGDLMAAYDEGIKRSLAAFGTPGALEQNVVLPFGEFPGAMFCALATTDTLTHGWDLAKATGQSTDIAPQLAEQMLEGVRATLPDEFRGADGVAPFGPERPAPASASSADELAAFLGRTV